MNNKFLITVFFLQSYLFAADLPYKELQIQSTHVNFEELENIIKNGDTQTLINILNSNDKTIQVINDDGLTALHVAAEYGHTDVIKLLLESQYAQQILQPTNYDTTALQMAYKSQNIDAVKQLLESKYLQQTLQPIKEGSIALLMAAYFGQIEVIKFLLDEKYAQQILQPMEWVMTPLHMAALTGEVKVIEFLLDERYTQYAEQILQPDHNGFTALHTAAQAGKLEVIKLLLDEKYVQQFLKPDNNGVTVLHMVAKTGQIEAIKLLLESKYAQEFLKPDNNGKTALHSAAEFGKIDVIKLFLESKYAQEFLKPDNNGETALHSAVLFKQVDTVKLLLNSRDLDFIKLLNNKIDVLKYSKDSYVWQLIYTTLLRRAYKNAKTQDDILQAQENAKNEIGLLAHGLDIGLEQRIFEKDFLKQLYKDLMPLANKSIINNATCFATPTCKMETYNMETADCEVCYKENTPLYVCLAGNDACRNKLCSDCINNNLNILCQNKTELPICSNNKCCKEICPQILESIGCDKNKILALRAHIFFLHNSKNPLWRFCRTTGCVAGLNLKSDDHYFACNICYFKGCLDCGEDHHDNCNIYLEQLKNEYKLYTLGKISPPAMSYSEYSEEQAEFYHGKHRMCPGCGVLSERIEGGCNSINCPKCSLKWHWNLGIPKNGESVPHDFDPKPMDKDYKQTLKDKGFLKKFDVFKKPKAE